MDKALKQRLVGASVLVALAVVILPMLLGGRPDSPQEAQPIEIPQRPAELSFETRRFPIGEQTPGQPSVMPEREAPGRDDTASDSVAGTTLGEAAPAETLQERLERVAAESADDITVPGDATGSGDTGALVETDVPADAETIREATQAAFGDAADTAAAGADPTAEAASADAVAETGSADAVAETESADAVAETESAAPPPPVSVEVPARSAAPQALGAQDGRYVVQVASFSSTANANRMAGTLREAGMPVLMDTVDSSAGVLHRVRIGPFAQQAEADQVLTRLSRQMPDVRPRIVDLRPDEAARVTETDDPLVRWAVQVGVFSESANAEKLVFQLRDAGFRAQSQRESRGGRTLYRVLVGPEVSRDDALRSRDRIEASQGIRGIVQSTD